jgi:lysophospholipase L1-like esterase
MAGRRSLLVLAALAATVLAGVAPATRASAAGTVPYPTSMGALGDSITRAYDVCCSYADHPEKSWSTGSSADTISSHYERLLTLDPGISGHVANLAVTGAKMSAGPTQAGSLPSDVQYVTILLGANDVCTSSASTMTSTSTFESEFWNTLFNVHWKAPHARIFVSSIPNVYQLWSTLHTNAAARLVWASAKICQSMLSGSNTESQRQAVLAREVAFNNAMQSDCTSSTYSSFCKWDSLATYNVRFSSSQVSTLDYFHPNASGQATLAATTWAASFWG